MSNSEANEQLKETSKPISDPPPRSTRGFGGMDPAKQRAISSKGGKAAHEKGTAHEFTPEEARSAGRKGGHAVSQDRNHMATIGRMGGSARVKARTSSR
jgi:uncharacterized protein